MFKPFLILAIVLMMVLALAVLGGCASYPPGTYRSYETRYAEAVGREVDTFNPCASGVAKSETRFRSRADITHDSYYGSRETREYNIAKEGACNTGQ
jgi:hypothetical protein